MKFTLLDSTNSTISLDVLHYIIIGNKQDVIDFQTHFNNKHYDYEFHSWYYHNYNDLTSYLFPKKRLKNYIQHNFLNKNCNIAGIIILNYNLNNIDMILNNINNYISIYCANIIIFNDNELHKKINQKNVDIICLIEELDNLKDIYNLINTNNFFNQLRQID